MKIAGFARIGTLPNEEEFYKYANSDVKTKRAPGLAELGIKPSRQVGDLLAALLEWVLDDPSRNDAALLIEW